MFVTLTRILPLQTAELMVDDIIVGIDNTVIRSQRDFTEFLKTHPEGADVVVTAGSS